MSATKRARELAAIDRAAKSLYMKNERKRLDKFPLPRELRKYLLEEAERRIDLELRVAFLEVSRVHIKARLEPVEDLRTAIVPVLQGLGGELGLLARLVNGAVDYLDESDRRRLADALPKRKPKRPRKRSRKATRAARTKRTRAIRAAGVKRGVKPRVNGVKVSPTKREESRGEEAPNEAPSEG